jgi:hypothetical protein
MKFASLLVAAAFWTLPNAAFAFAHKNTGCHNFYDRCLGASTKPEICKALYDASIKEGGVWGSPAARAATKTSGGSEPCHVE